MNNFPPACTTRLSIDVLAIILIFIIASCSEATAQNLILDNSFKGSASESRPENYVSAVQPDGKILVGGMFDFANGTALTGLARLNADGSLDTTFNTGGSGLDGSVHAIVLLSDGNILIGGSFTHYNGTPTSRNFARINANGTLDAAFNPGGSGVSAGSGSGRVTSIAILTDGRIIAAGQGISGYNGVTNNGIFRANADGTLDSSFVSGFGSASSDQIEEVAIQPDGKVVVALDHGNHTYGGVNVGNLVRINPDATLDTGFSTVSVFNNSIYGLAIQPDGKILVGGPFIILVPTEINGIARVNSDGSLDGTFTPPAWMGSAAEYLQILPNGQILAAGEFYPPPGQRATMVRLHPDGSLDTSFVFRTDDYGYHIASQPDGKILLNGFFSKLSTGQTYLGIVRVEANGAVDTSFNPVFTRRGGAITAMARQPDGKVIVGGLFVKANGNISHNIARFTAGGNFDASFNVGSGPTSDPGYTPVNAISVLPDGKILVGGLFYGFNGSNRIGLVRLNADGSVDESFSLSGVNLTPGATSSGVTDILVLPDGKILICGDRIQIPGSSFAKFLVRLNADGSLDTSFNSNAPGSLSSALGYRIIIQPDGKIIVVGQYIRLLPSPSLRGNIFRFNSDGSLDGSFTPFTSTGFNLPPLADAALQPDGKIVVVGNPPPYSGIATIARLNANGTADSGFVGPAANGGVHAVALRANGKMLIGGAFTNLNGSPRNRLARLNMDGSLDDGFISGLDNSVLDYGGVNSLLIEPDARVFVAGGFTAYNGVPRNNLLRLDSGNALFDYDGDSRSDISVFRPSTGAWYLQRSSAGFYGQNFGSAEDRIAPSDYDGDGKTDIAVYRPSTGIWYVTNSSTGTVSYYAFGIVEDLPTPADYDGDGKADVSVFRPSTGTWYRINSSDGSFTAGQFGTNGDKPAIGDFDGDGKADLSVFRPSTGAWYQTYSSNGTFFGEQFGISTDKITPADYDGDGKTDIAIYRPSEGLWYVKRSATTTYVPYVFGLAADIPVPGDFDGDGKADIGVFRPSDGTWYIVNSSNSSYTIFQFGQSGDHPTQSAFNN